MSTNINDLERENNSLIAAIEERRRVLNDASLSKLAADKKVQPADVRLKLVRKWKSHEGKIYSSAWCADSQHLVSAAQDGKLIVWDAFANDKIQAFKLRSMWVMACAYAPSGALIASGGLDNMCTIWKVSGELIETEPQQELSGHKGFLAACQFINDNNILSSSGDGTTALWDISKRTMIRSFAGHEADVLGLHLSPTSNDVFATSSVDKTVRIWDVRSGRNVQRLTGLLADINTVRFFPNGNAVGAGDDSGNAKLFDLRANQAVATFAQPEDEAGMSSLTFSHSGRLMFAGYHDCMIGVWDTLTGERISNLNSHIQRVTSVEVSKDGMSLSTVSWDATVQVWSV